MVFAEKTIPTSMLFALLTWCLYNPRGSAAVRKKSFTAMNDIINLCSQTGQFSVHVLLRPGFSVE